MDRLAVDEKSGAPLRFARRLWRTAGRPRRSISADSRRHSRRTPCSASAADPRGQAVGGRQEEEEEEEEEAPQPGSRGSPCAAQGRLRPGWRGGSSSATCLAPIVGNNKTSLCLHSPEEDVVGTVDGETSFPVEKDHRRTCESALLPCHFGCVQAVTRQQLSDHLRNDCTKASLHSGCHQVETWHEHQNLAVVSLRADGCRFSGIGCPFQGDAKERDSHEAGALGDHLRLLLQHVQELKACLSLAGEETEKASADKEVSTRFPFHPVAQGVPEGEFLSGLPLYEEGMPWQNLTRRTQGVSLLETKLQVFENIVSVLSKEMAASRRSFVAFRGQRGLDQDMIRGLELKIADLQRCLVQKDAALGQLEARFRASGQASYDGVFLWKIADVHHKSYEAVCGKLSSLQSPAFYTSRYGYKLCLRIYLNGEGSSKGSYVSLFLVLLKGEYDALLPWPFAHKITLTLLDQNSGEHFANTIHPDPTSPSFQRPVGEMNEASGFPRFIPLAKLQSPKYAFIKEGTIFLQCVAHTGS